MHFNEEQRGYQATSYTPTLGEQPDNYNTRFTEAPAQKIGFLPGNSLPSAGQRLALAIVSMSLVMIALPALFSSNTASLFILVIKLVALIVVCLTAVLINVVFNWRR